MGEGARRVPRPRVHGGGNHHLGRPAALVSQLAGSLPLAPPAQPLSPFRSQFGGEGAHRAPRPRVHDGGSHYLGRPAALDSIVLESEPQARALGSDHRGATAARPSRETRRHVAQRGELAAAEEKTKARDDKIAMLRNYSL